MESFEQATTDERIAALEAIVNRDTTRMDGGRYLPAYEFVFTKVRREDFPQRGVKKGSVTNYRQHYTVVVTNNTTRITEAFSYFQGESERVGTYGNSPVKQDAHERRLSFIYCLVLDYGMIEHQGMKDALDLISEGLCEKPDDARETWNNLVNNHSKIKRLFERSDWAQLERIMEGY
jgi:hypothetical protein